MRVDIGGHRVIANHLAPAPGPDEAATPVRAPVKRAKRARKEIGGHDYDDDQKDIAPGGVVFTDDAAQFGAGATAQLIARISLPPSPIPIHTSEQGAIAILSAAARVPLASILSDLAALQSQRTFCIKSQSRCDRSTESMIARFLGYRSDAAEKDRKAVWKQASAIRNMVEVGEGHSVSDSQVRSALAACSLIIMLSAASRRGWDNHRTQVEKQMRQLAKQLPVWPWVEQVRGFGELGLAIIAAETGDLANYATKERVWKRLGLAVIDGERQQRKTGVEAAAAHGYSPRRRAEVWSLFSDAMFRLQWAGDKDADGKNPVLTKKPVAVPAHPIGPYGEAYARRKARTVTREGWTPGHRHNDARRIMTKVLIEDLWKVWRQELLA